MSAMPPETAQLMTRITGRRAVPRLRVAIPAEVLLLQGAVKCQLDNISQHGARITLGTPAPRPGSSVVLQVEQLDAFGTIIWAIGQRFGLQFDELVPLPQIVSIRHYADTYGECEARLNERNARSFVHGRPRLRSLR